MEKEQFRVSMILKQIVGNKVSPNRTSGSIGDQINLIKVSEYRFKMQIKNKWWILLSPLGGWSMSLMLKPLEVVYPEYRVLTATMHFLHRIQREEVVLDIEEISRRRHATVTVKLIQEGEVRGLLVATLRKNDGEEAENTFDMEKTFLPDRNDCEVIYQDIGNPPLPFFQNVETWLIDPNTIENENRFWFKMKDPNDFYSLPVISDLGEPPIRKRIGRENQMATMRLTLNFFEVPHPNEWICLTIRVSSVRKNYFNMRIQIHNEQGSLLCEGSQMMLISSTKS